MFEVQISFHMKHLKRGLRCSVAICIPIDHFDSHLSGNGLYLAFHLLRSWTKQSMTVMPKRFLKTCDERSKIFMRLLLPSEFSSFLRAHHHREILLTHAHSNLPHVIRKRDVITQFKQIARFSLPPPTPPPYPLHAKQMFLSLKPHQKSFLSFFLTHRLPNKSSFQSCQMYIYILHMHRSKFVTPHRTTFSRDPILSRLEQTLDFAAYKNATGAR